MKVPVMLKISANPAIVIKFLFGKSTQKHIAWDYLKGIRFNHKHYNNIFACQLSS